MANDFFEFKKFKVNQKHAAMKVCTDSCLFGALVPVKTNYKVLDIGTGTGLLSLMLAQKKEVQITSVESDQDSIKDASDNISSSPFNEQITLINQRIQDFALQHSEKFDLIICNPPFFENHLKPDNKNTNAIHNDDLPYEDLVSIINKLLSEDGEAYIMYPPHQMTIFERIASFYSLNVLKKIEVRDKKDKDPIRYICCFVKSESIIEPVEQEIIIKEENGEYSKLFTDLLSPYYLKL